MDTAAWRAVALVLAGFIVGFGVGHWVIEPAGTGGHVAEVAPQLEDSLVAEQPVRDEPTATSPPLPETGVLVLTNVSSRGRVFLDGVEVRGLTHELSPGSVHVRVTRSGYEDFEASVRVGRRDTAIVSVRWTRIQPVAPPRQDPAPDPTPLPVPQCTNPVQRDTYNLNNRCFDVGPQVIPEGPWIVPLDAEVELPAQPSILWVRVESDGNAGAWRSAARERTQFDAVALVWARRYLTFQPAMKNGQPVTAWVRLALQGGRR